MTTVAECASVEEAEVLRSLLEDCGVTAYLPDELAVTYRGVVGSIRLQVAEEDADSARRILAARKG